MPSLQKPSIETKLRTLRQILCDIDRYQQKARPPVPVNTKGAKSVLGIREHQSRIKKLKSNKSFNMNERLKEQQPSLWRKCTNYYHNLIKQRERKPSKQSVTKRQQDLVLQQYQRVRRRHQRNVADDKIDKEYERLQQKFCPSFTLTKPLPPPKFGVKRKHMTNKIAANMANAKMICSRSTYKMSNNITRSKINLQAPLASKPNKANSITLAKGNKTEQNQVKSLTVTRTKQTKPEKKDLKSQLKSVIGNSELKQEPKDFKPYRPSNIIASKGGKGSATKELKQDAKDIKQNRVKSLIVSKLFKHDPKRNLPLSKEINENEGVESDDSEKTLMPENEHLNASKVAASISAESIHRPDISKYRIVPFSQKPKPPSNDIINMPSGKAFEKPFEKTPKTCQEINCALMNKLFYNKMNNNNLNNNLNNLNNNNNNLNNNNNNNSNNNNSNNSIIINNNHTNDHNNILETYKLKYKEVEIRREIKEAIEEGKSTDPLLNNSLANVIYKAQREHVPWSAVKSMIDNFKMTNTHKKVLHLLQIQLRHSVFIICTVRTSNFSKLLYTLDKAMRPLNAKFAAILQHFTHCCVIEAVVPNKYRSLNVKELRKRLDKQVEALNLKRIDIVDAARGEIAIQCMPVAMPNVSRAFELKGYKILNSDYGFRANKEIILDTRTAAEYRRLINFLKDIPDIETITDNVIY